MTDVNASSWTQHASVLVRDVIERDGVIRQSLARGLVNTRALARTIELESGGKVSFDAILSAIRRYPVRESSQKRGDVGRLILKLSLKNRITVLSLRNEAALQREIYQYSESVNYAAGETFRVVTSMDRVSVTMDSKNAEALESRVRQSLILRKLNDLAEIVLEMSQEIEERPGILSTITTELEINDVNVRQFTTVGPGRIIILVNERDATTAYHALEELVKK